MILWPSTLSKIRLFCYNDACPGEQFGCSKLVCLQVFLACKINEGLMGVFLMFEHVMLAAMSAESLRVPHSV